MRFDHKESGGSYHCYGMYYFAMTALTICLSERTAILITRPFGFFPCRNTPSNWAFHSLKHRLRMPRMLSKPSWLWRPKLRIALDHHPVQLKRPAKLKLIKVVQLKTISLGAVEQLSSYSFILFFAKRHLKKRERKQKNNILYEKKINK